MKMDMTEKRTVKQFDKNLPKHVHLENNILFLVAEKLIEIIN